MKKQKKKCSITAMITLIVLTHTIVNALMLAGMIVYGFYGLTRSLGAGDTGLSPCSFAKATAHEEVEKSKAGVTEIHGK